MFLLMMYYHYKVLLRVQVWDLYMTLSLFQYQIHMLRNRNPNVPNYSKHHVLYIETSKVFDSRTHFWYSLVVKYLVLPQCLCHYSARGNQNNYLVYLANAYFKQMLIENAVTTSLTLLTHCDVHIDINR